MIVEFATRDRVDADAHALPRKDQLMLPIIEMKAAVTDTGAGTRTRVDPL